MTSIVKRERREGELLHIISYARYPPQMLCGGSLGAFTEKPEEATCPECKERYDAHNSRS